MRVPLGGVMARVDYQGKGGDQERIQGELGRTLGLISLDPGSGGSGMDMEKETSVIPTCTLPDM